MSSIKLISASEANLELHYKETGILAFQETDKNGVVQDVTGKSYELQFYSGQYVTFKEIDATLDEVNNKFTFSIEDSFWTGYKFETQYAYKVWRVVDGQRHPILYGNLKLID